MGKIGDIQDILGVKRDEKWGPISQAALDAAKHPAPPPVILPPPPPLGTSNSKVDERSERSIITLAPPVQLLARALIRAAVAAGINMKVTSGLRSYAEQEELYQQGRSTPGKIVTDAHGGYSNHNFGLAFDLTLFKDSGDPIWDSPFYAKVGQMGKALGLYWGGDWIDPHDEPHFELRPKWAANLSELKMITELRRRHSTGQDIFA